MSTQQPTSFLKKVGSELTTFEIVVGVVIAIILANLVQRFLNNLFYRTLELDKKSAYVALIISVAAFLIFFVFLYFVSSFSREIILGGVVGRSATHRFLGSEENSVVIDPLPRCNCNDSR